MENPRIDIWTFALDGVRFALPQADVIETMPIGLERWVSLARMAETGTLGGTGLPLLRLAARLGVATVRPPRKAALLLVGEAGRIRGTVLIDDEPQAARADCVPIPAALSDPAGPHAGLITGMAVMSGGLRAILLDIPTGIADARPRPVERADREEVHLLVRLVGESELCAVPLAALRGPGPYDRQRGRAVRLTVEGVDGRPAVIGEVAGPAPHGRLERIASQWHLVTPSASYPLLGARPGAGGAVGAAARLRVLVVAPQDEACERLRNLLRELGHEVSLADDPRAAALARRRFDIVLIDLDTHGDAGVDMTAGTRIIGLARDGAPPRSCSLDEVIPAGDHVALIAALLPTRSQAA